MFYFVLRHIHNCLCDASQHTAIEMLYNKKNTTHT